jgi:hypothetical protein
VAMSDKPKHASGYDRNRTAVIRRACLEVATRLNDFKDDLCIIGGLVPSLLVDMAELSPGAPAHIGTNDLDLGLSLAIFDGEKYEEIAKRLRHAGFHPDVNESGNQTSQRWRLADGVLVDFLIQPSSPHDKGGKLRNLEGDFAAVITPGLHLAFLDFEEVNVRGETLTGGKAERRVRVCGPGAFVVLKSLAFQGRAENKDAYDLWYVLQNRGDAVDRLKNLASDPIAQAALDVLARDFADADSVGPVRAAKFLYDQGDENLQADFAGLVRGVLAAIRAENS